MLEQYKKDVETLYDNLWDHWCPVEKIAMKVGKGQECNWCGAKENKNE